jgi:hypothetical protein
MSRNKLPANVVQNLFEPAGEAMFTMTFNHPWRPPVQGSSTLLKAPSLETMTHLELTQTPGLRVTRVSSAGTYVAEVNIETILDADTWVVLLRWDPTGLILNVGDNETSDKLLKAIS